MHSMKTPASSIIALAVSLALFIAQQAFAQPYIDVINVRQVLSPGSSVTQADKSPGLLNYFNVSATLPIQFKNKKDALVLTPFFEKWTSGVGTDNGYSANHYGLALPVSLLKFIPGSRWGLMTMAIVRMNDANISKNGQFQFGGALVGAMYKAGEHLTYKMGVYVNGEFFGLFIIPLLGIDWKINDKTNLFGILPASLTLERRLAKRLYAGAAFRTFTNSYHDSGNQYIRIDENQLGLFMDYYPARHLVLNLEAGHSLFRKIRSGTRYDIKNNWNAQNNFYVKLTLAYRLRFR